MHQHSLLKKTLAITDNKKSASSFFKSVVQPKLTINQSNDIYEQEADAMADKVMRMPDTAINNSSFFSSSVSSLQRKCAHCEEEKKKIHRKEINNNEAATNTSTENYVQSLNGKGRSLSKEERNFFEPQIGYDFSNVKIHDDSVAAKSAQSINALAYTTGNNIVFGANQYQPNTDSGKKLMAHELTHVVQQKSDIATKRIQRYSGCSSTQDTIVSDDHDRARQMLSTAISNISSCNGTNPAKVHNALDRNFNGSTSNAFATWINMNLRILWSLTWMAGYDCFNGGIVESTWACRGRDLATTFWCVPAVNIRLCPSYFGQTPIERSTTMIHEWVHKYGCNFDLGYEHEPGYSGNSTVTQLLNADSFSSLVRDVQ